MSTEGPRADWYPDPQRSGWLRYWNGQQWTEDYQQLPPAPQPQPSPPTPMPVSVPTPAVSEFSASPGASRPARRPLRTRDKVLIGVASAVVLIVAVELIGGASGGHSSAGPSPTSPASSTAPSPTPKSWRDILKPGRTQRSAITAACAPVRQLLTAREKTLAAQNVQAARGTKDPWAAAAFVGAVSWSEPNHSASLSLASDQKLSGVLDAVAAQNPTPDQRSAFANDVLRGCHLQGAYNTATARATRLDGALTTLATMAKEMPWYPKGFKEFSDGLAWRWVPNGQVNCGAYSLDGCFQMRVITRDGCSSSLYAEVTTYDSAGNAVGLTNDTTGALQPGDSAKLTLQIVDANATNGRVSTITCY